MLCCCSDPEFKGSWARFHVDLGTADELAMDVLINMLVGFSFEVCRLGGLNLLLASTAAAAAVSLASPCQSNGTVVSWLPAAG